MVFSHRFRERVSSRTQQTSDPAATAAAVKTMMRCVVICGLLLGGLQFSMAPSISFSVAVTLSGESETAQSSATGSSEHKSVRFADPIQQVHLFRPRSYEDLEILKPGESETAQSSATESSEHKPEREMTSKKPRTLKSFIQKCFHSFVDQSWSQEYALKDLDGIPAPLPRWKWLKDEMNEGDFIINFWRETNRDFPAFICDPPGLAVALEVKLFKRFDARKIKLDEPQKTLIFELIQAVVSFKYRKDIKKIGSVKKRWLKNRDLAYLSGQCGGVLARYFIAFGLQKETKVAFCREIPNVFPKKAIQ